MWRVQDFAVVICKERHIMLASHLASSSDWPTLEEVVSEFWCPATESNEKSWQHSIFLRLFENLVIRNWHRQTWNPASIEVVVNINLNIFLIHEPTIEEGGFGLIFFEEGGFGLVIFFQDDVDEESMLCHLRAWKQIPRQFPKLIPSEANETKLRDANTPANA